MNVLMHDADRIAGILLGTALGDALGLACEGMTPLAIHRRFGTVRRFHLLGRTGFVSDDTEQAALLAQAISRAHDDDAKLLRYYRRSLVGWFWRLPFGIGWSTLKACLRMTAGIAAPGVFSAGNGAAMRAPILGGLIVDPDRRLRAGRAIAELTHTDPMGVDGALYTAEVTAGLIRDLAPRQAVTRALAVVQTNEMRTAIAQAIDLADAGVPTTAAAQTLGNTGFVVHTVGLATYGLLVAGQDVLNALADVISAGGDTDTIAAILGAWLGAQCGAAALPSLVDRIAGGPFGPAHLRALAASAAAGTEPPRFSVAWALLRNLALYPVILAHGFRRLLPF
jgi:ADP-ribosylglycohydrolase